MYDCEKQSVLVDFEMIPTCLPVIDMDISDLSSDQQYLYDIVTAVSNGECPATLANKDPGKMCHSRWLTTGNRILRLYVSTETPTNELKVMAKYVAKVYAPSWFAIKKQAKVSFGAQHLHGIITKSAFLPLNLQQVVFETIQRNAYFAHSENMLLCMLADERPYVRELALRRILKARTVVHEGDSPIRQFIVPTLNFQAKDYFNMIGWDRPLEPPATVNMSDVEIKTLIETGCEPDIVKLPCHTQAVERHIKLVTEASSHVCGETARDGFIRTRQKARDTVPTFETKKEYFAVSN